LVRRDVTICKKTCVDDKSDIIYGNLAEFALEKFVNRELTRIWEQKAPNSQPLLMLKPALKENQYVKVPKRSMP